MNHLKHYSIIILSALVFLLGACKNKDVTPDTFKISNEKVEATASSVTIRGSYDFIGHVEGMEINIGKREDLIDADRHEMQLEGSDFSVTVIGLDPNTLYYYCFSVDFGNNDGFLTETKSFRTLPLTDAPTVETVGVLCIDSTTFRVDCKVISVGGGEVTERGVYWNTYGDPTNVDSITVCTTVGDGEYSCILNGLNGNTRYYVRAYATNSHGTGAGNTIDFRTGTTPGAPTVSTEAITGVEMTSATVGGMVSADGGSPLTERGVCWSIHEYPTTDDDKELATGTELGHYAVTVTGLEPNTTYHVRCYATNARGTGYGEPRQFTTADGKPTVATYTVTNITATTATGGGEVTISGASAVTERGICWSKNHNPTTSDHSTAEGQGLGSFTMEMTGLETGQTYYVRAYAMNSYGTAYGDEVQFTPSDGLPVVRTDTVTDITRTSAKGHGTVIAEGANAVTERGICWSTSSNPTLNNCLGHANGGTSTGSFACNISDLEPGTTYYMAAYARNSKGIAYGTAKSFTTLPPEHYTISVSAHPSIGGTVSGGGQYNNNQSCTVSATANAGYAFVKWTENGEEVSTEANYTFTVTSNRVLVAEFQVQSYTIEVSANPSNGGVVSGGGTYNYGHRHTVHATDASDYTFTNWTENGSVVSTDADYTFNVTNNRDLVANFTYNSVGGHGYVDLGLPSGLLWATCNVGANVPEEYGTYFGWGETQPKNTYHWGVYQWCNGSNNTLTKYCDNSDYGYNGFTDTLTILLPEDDAATANWGNDWRMPRIEEWEELYQNTTQSSMTQNGVDVMVFTSSNGNIIVLPKAGYLDGGYHYEHGDYGIYWSSSLYTGTPDGAWSVMFAYSICLKATGWRYTGLPIRAVCHY